VIRRRASRGIADDARLDAHPVEEGAIALLRDVRVPELRLPHPAADDVAAAHLGDHDAVVR